MIFANQDISPFGWGQMAFLTRRGGFFSSRTARGNLADQPFFHPISAFLFFGFRPAVP
jgi:hypothetical protein